METHHINCIIKGDDSGMSSKKKAIRQRILESAQIPEDLSRGAVLLQITGREEVYIENFRIYRLRYFDPREAGKDFDRRQIPSDSVLYLRRDENYRTDRPDPLFIRRQKLGFEASFIPKRDAEDKRNR